MLIHKYRNISTPPKNIVFHFSKCKSKFIIIMQQSFAVLFLFMVIGGKVAIEKLPVQSLNQKDC